MELERLMVWMEPWIDTTFVAPPFDGQVAAEILGASGRSEDAHAALLQRWNGFYGLGGALHVLGACVEPPNHSLRAWNEATGWRASWGRHTEGLTFFAQTAFGDHFGYRGGKVVRFHSRTGRVEALHATLVEWIEAVVLEPEYMIGQRMFDACAAVHGPLPHGGMFVPSAPTAVDEPFTPEKVRIVPARDAMELYAVAAARPVRRSSASMRAIKP